MAKKEKRKKRYLFEEVLEALRGNSHKPMNYKQLASALSLGTTTDREAVQAILADLLEKDMVEEPERGKFRLKHNQQVLTGTLDFTSSGAAYFVSVDKEEDVYIAARNTNGALHGDSVKVKVYPRRRSDGREEGEVLEVLERARTEFVGTISIQGRTAFVRPDNARHPDFFIPKDGIGNAKDGQKVVVRLTGWEEFSESPTGEIVSVLGMPGMHATEMNAIMVEYGLPPRFPKSVEDAAAQIDITITPQEISRRVDFRAITTFTIDPVDAKDFDDALSVLQLENGNWEVGVHIADVSHYMAPGTMLDKEALNRATSVYLVDRVVPMLPEILSNYVCSLRPHEDKLCFSAVFELNAEAQIVREWFGRTIIHSDRRFTYEEVQEILEGKPGDFAHELHVLNTLAKKLRAERFRKGSITFEKEEVKFHLDENGNPMGVFFKVMKDSNQLIEDFMLLANKRVAEYVALQRRAGEKPAKQQDLRRPFVYRVHSPPDMGRVEEFSLFVRGFGYRMDVGSEKSLAASYNKLLQEVKGKPEANMIETLAVRTMAKAYYTTKNIGHYGLGFGHYTHFTSPIRRYPDVLAHRLLQFYLDAETGKRSREDAPQERLLESQCKHSSEQEKKAAEAERASIKFKQVQFLEARIGQVFEGIISGVQEYGFFVELKENKCEGLVRMRELSDDYYLFEQERHRIVGSRTGRVFQLGDTVSVRVKNADIIRKQVDFEVAEEGDDRRGSKKDAFSRGDSRSPGGRRGKIERPEFRRKEERGRGSDGKKNNRGRSKGSGHSKGGKKGGKGKTRW